MAVSSYTGQTVAVSANVQPIYPRTIFSWAVPLKSEVCPMIITNQVPQLVGNGGQNGALIHGIEVQSLGVNTGTNLRLYTQPLNSGGYTSTPSVNLNYFPLCQVPLFAQPSTEATNVSIPLYSILPTGNKGLHLAPGETLYAALSDAIEVGLVLRVRGGWY